MKISLWSIGKAHEPSVKTGIEEYTKRVNNYFPAEWTILPPVKNGHALSAADLKKKEGEAVLLLLKPDDYLVALDEKGKQHSSEALSAFLAKCSVEATKNVIFLIGGAYGLDPVVLQKAKWSWSLSLLTFPHQLVRLILAEQIYRACTILRNEKYHHK